MNNFNSFNPGEPISGDQSNEDSYETFEEHMEGMKQTEETSEKTEREPMAPEQVERMRRKLIEANALSAVGGIETIYILTNEAYSRRISGSNEIIKFVSKKILNGLDDLENRVLKSRNKDKIPLTRAADQFEPGNPSHEIYTPEINELEYYYRIGLLSIAGSEKGVKKASMLFPQITATRTGTTTSRPHGFLGPKVETGAFQLSYGDPKQERIVQSGFEIAKKVLPELIEEKVKDIIPEQG